MSVKPTKIAIVLVVVLLLLFVSNPAHAFRCKSKLVKDGMHEQQVIAVCGEPTTRRILGSAIRSYNYGYRRNHGGGLSSRRAYPGVGALAQEVYITEYVYNFGPRKLMRRLIFEGGVLVTIETIGYGYIEK